MEDERMKIETWKTRGHIRLIPALSYFHNPYEWGFEFGFWKWNILIYWER